MKDVILNCLGLLITVSLVISCATKEDETYCIKIDSPSTHSLDEFLNRVELIPLETTDSNLIKNITKVVFYRDEFYIKDIYEGLFVFDTTGHFIRKIGRKGSGPGEYGYISDFCINKFTSNLELLGPRGDIMIFGLDGKYVNKLTYKSIEVSNFLLVSEDLILFYHQSQTPALSLYSRSSQKVIKSFFDLPENFVRRRPFFLISPPFYLSGNDTLIHYGYTNEIYTFRNLSIEKRNSFNFKGHNFNMKDYNWSLDYDKNYYRELLWSERNVVIGFNNHFENERFILKQIYYQEGSGLVLIDKKEGKSFFIQAFKNLSQIRNDEVSWQNVTSASVNGTRIGLVLNWDSGEDYILTSVDPAKKDFYINPNTLDSVNYDKFKKIGLSDNPFLVKYYFKP
jgi:hypothetical protein